MGKTITLPTWINTVGFNSNITYPSDSSKRVVDGQDITISNTTFSELRGDLSNTSYSIYDIYNNNNVNEFARYRADYTSLFYVGEFAGYNHNALPCSYYYNNDSRTVTKYYSSGFKFDIDLTVTRAERSALHSNSESSWADMVIEFEYNSTKYYEDIIVDSQSITTNNTVTFTIPVSDGESDTKTVYARAYYIVPSGTDYDDRTAIQLTGYGAGNEYGLIIEDYAQTISLTLNSAPASDFSALWTWNSTQEELFIQMSPITNIVYEFDPFSAVGATLSNQSYGTTNAVTDVDLGVDGDGTVSISITGTETGKSATTKNYSVLFIDDEIAPD